MALALHSTMRVCGGPRRMVVVAAAAAPRARTSALIRKLASSNASQFSSFQGVKMLVPEAWVPIGTRMGLTVSSTSVRRKPVLMSFLGVGAPEAILVAIVALVVFGPKGLAEAARSLGSTLKAFQPTIREVVEVSQDIKGTLEKELGLDEIREAARPLPRSAAPRAADSPAAPLEDLQRPGTSGVEATTEVDADLEAKRAASASAAWGAAPPAPAKPVAAASTNDLATMSIEALEAELARRKAAPKE